jgi:hypothetical protein
MNDPIQMLIDAGAIPATPFEPTSRYRGVPMAVYQPRPRDPKRAYVKRRFIAPAAALSSAVRHVVTQGERPDLLAFQYLGDPLLYWRIADVNAVIDPHELTDTPGRRVSVPTAGE